MSGPNSSQKKTMRVIGTSHFLLTISFICIFPLCFLGLQLVPIYFFSCPLMLSVKWSQGRRLRVDEVRLAFPPQLDTHTSSQVGKEDSISNRRRAVHLHPHGRSKVPTPAGDKAWTDLIYFHINHVWAGIFLI